MLEGKFRAREIDFERAAPSDDVSATGDKGAGGDAGATGTRLVLNTALVGADEEGSIGMKFNKIDIGTVREKVGTVANTTSFAHNVVVFQVEDMLHEMRGTGVEEDAQPPSSSRKERNVSRQTLRMESRTRPRPVSGFQSRTEAS